MNGNRGKSIGTRSPNNPRNKAKPGRKNGKNRNDEIVEELVRFRIKDRYSTFDLLNHCKDEHKLSESQSYELVKRAKLKIAEYAKDYAINAIEESISELEDQLRDAQRTGEKKLRLEITKEINKVKSIYLEKTQNETIIRVKYDEGDDTDQS